MSENLGALRRKMTNADELQSVVRTMKALAASNIGQYERSTRALGDYFRTVELGLSACFRQSEPPMAVTRRGAASELAAVVFGSDQGLVGQFDDVIAEFAIAALAARPERAIVWAVGDRVRDRFLNAGLTVEATLPVPISIQAITPLVAQIQLATEARRSGAEFASVFVFHNRPAAGALYEPVGRQLLPLDAGWRDGLLRLPWPTANLPEVIGNPSTLHALVREYLFISLFRACGESLAAENASRLAAMERAEKNINDLRGNLSRAYHRLRQAGIDEELFDVISGYEALTVYP